MVSRPAPHPPVLTGFRKSPRMDDKKGSTATFGSVHKGDLVQGDITQMLNSAGGFIPMMTATQQVRLLQCATPFDYFLHRR